MAREININTVALSQEIIQELIEAVSAMAICHLCRCINNGEEVSQVPSVRAQINDDGTLTIFMSALSDIEGVAENIIGCTKVPAGQWSYRH